MVSNKAFSNRVAASSRMARRTENGQPSQRHLQPAARGPQRPREIETDIKRPPGSPFIASLSTSSIEGRS